MMGFGRRKPTTFGLDREKFLYPPKHIGRIFLQPNLLGKNVIIKMAVGNSTSQISKKFMSVRGGRIGGGDRRPAHK
jgi:hypothetical protein